MLNLMLDLALLENDLLRALCSRQGIDFDVLRERLAVLAEQANVPALTEVVERIDTRGMDINVLVDTLRDARIEVKRRLLASLGGSL